MPEDASPELVRQMIDEVGEDGVAAIRRMPGLAAAVDQHAAAIRDVIAASGDELTPRVLRDYLEGFTDAAIERGWWPTDDFDWETVRVIAVCWLIRELQVR
ncbi:DUF6401 family natural product biosynthesis protein [Actinoallomurus purpureus]|uniref:DUF6401 family natural product biosynthesis protein n=1 Tax=Actinoallomurus purpureus TaxID=478114 RepID=UPI00209200A1|nr:DUF6401 family natural product biosynthesis protein [Actinoallomurus purpureus]MCO6010116.1 DUF6401 family natural product biosynthesis protein [Actinoallomurus purpureus]